LIEVAEKAGPVGGITGTARLCLPEAGRLQKAKLNTPVILPCMEMEAGA
jgi:hypothetical protein